MDLFFGRRGASNEDIDAEIARQNQSAGYLDSGREEAIRREEEAANKVDPRLQHRVDRTTADLDRVAERARASHFDPRHTDKFFKKIERGVNKVGVAENPSVRRMRDADLRHKIRRSYDKLQAENENRLEKMRRKGATDRQLREADTEMRKMREGMEKIYRDAHGSGRLK